MHRMIRAFVVLLSLIWVAQASAQTMALTGSGEPAQSAVSLPANLTPETVRELVSRLSDQEVRQLLLQHLDSVARDKSAQSNDGGAAISELVASWGTGVSDAILDAVVRVPLLGNGLFRAFSAFAEDRGYGGIAKFFFGLFAGVVAGLIAYFLVLRSPLQKFKREINDTSSLRETMQTLAVRLAVDLLSLVVYLIVSITVNRAILDEQDYPFARLFMFNLVVVPLAAAAFSRFLLSPKSPNMRLLYADEWTAKYLHRSQLGIAILAGFSIFIVNFSTMNGVPMGETRLGFWLNLAIFTWLGVIVYRARTGITKMLIGNDEDVTQTEVRTARAYPAFMIFMIVAVWLLVEILVSQKMFHLLQGGRHFITLALVAMAPVLDTMVRGLVRHLVPPMQGEGVVAEKAYRSSKRSYVRIGRVIVFGIVIMLIAGQWGIDFSNLASAGLGVQFAGRFFEALFILATGYLVWEVVTLLLNRKLAAEQTAAGIDLSADEPGGGEGGGQGGSRLSTVLPMIRLVVQTGIIAMTVLVALGNLGIDITPLLAGAGIVGIAIGFGAQTLVRDVVSGIFFLIDDAFRVGEYLVIGDTVGTVEKLSVRSLQLRHHTGPIHTVPYGEIPKVTNNSRDWVIMKLKFTFPFETDVNRIKKIFKKVGQDMLDAPYADDMFQTFKSQGVYAVDDVGIVIRGKFMTKPGAQWIIRKDIYARVQKALDEAGIQFARKEVRVQIPGLEDKSDLTGPQKTAIAAGAADAAEKPEAAKT